MTTLRLCTSKDADPEVCDQGLRALGETILGCTCQKSHLILGSTCLDPSLSFTVRLMAFVWFYVFIVFSHFHTEAPNPGGTCVVCVEQSLNLNH